MYARPLIALMLLSALPGSVPAQETGRTYQVEVVIFEQSGPTAETLVFPEAPVEAPGVPQEGARDEGEGTSAEPLPTQEGPLTETQAASGDETQLPDFTENFGTAIDEPRLEGIVRKLNSGGYPVLWHQAWTQTASPRSDEQFVPLAVLAAFGGGEAAPELTGSVMLAAGRYLHLGLDLSMPAPGEGEYVLSQRRRVKIDELNYFDHPRLGAITLVTVPEQPTPADDQARVDSPGPSR